MMKWQALFLMIFTSSLPYAGELLDIFVEMINDDPEFLRSSKKPPIPYHQMFHLAEAVASTTQPLSGIPLMESIAIQSLGAYLRRKEDEGH